MRWLDRCLPICTREVLLDMLVLKAQGRNGHRAGMLFPLLLSVSQRLAALLSSVMMGLVALAATLLFAKKAFLLSAAALAVAAWDANRRKHAEPAPEIHVHSRIPVYHQEYYPEHYEGHEDSYKNDFYGVASHEGDYATASNNYGTIATPHSQPFNPSQRQQLNSNYGITESQQYYGQVTQANNQIPYRSPYRYRKGRG